MNLESGDRPLLYAQASRLFGDESRFWRFCAATLGAFAVLKGTRMPSTWAATQAQLDYSHGFIKRGLQGEVLKTLGVHRYSVLSAVFFLQLALFLLMLVVLTRRSRLEERFGSAAVLALCASSYAVTYLTHLVGYTDILLGLIATVLLVLRNPQVRFWIGLVLVPIALLVHENFLFLFLPLVLFSFFLDWKLTTGETERRRIAIYGWVLCVVAIGLTLVTSLQANMSVAQTSQFMREVESRADFAVREDFFDTLSRSLAGNMRVVLAVMQTKWWWQAFTVSTITILPVLLLLLRYLNRLLRLMPGSGDDATHRSTVLVTRVVVFAPLSMYALGWDCARWNVLCLLSAFLVLVLLSRTLPEGRIRFDLADRHAVILMMAVNMASGYGFFDDFNVNPYPFFPALHVLSRLVRH